jgi:hypothetical protein
MRDSYGFVLDITCGRREAHRPRDEKQSVPPEGVSEMFNCERCGIRFSTGALSGRRDCPRCKTRDGVTVLLTWEPLLAARTAAAVAEARAKPERVAVGPGP